MRRQTALLILRTFATSARRTFARQHTQEQAHSQREDCRRCRVPGRPNHSQLDQVPKEPAGSITVQPYAAVAGDNRGGRARSQRDVAVPDAACRPSAQEQYAVQS